MADEPKDATRSALLIAAEGLCDDFAAASSIQTILSHFASQTPPEAFEHGAPSLAPFLGRSFTHRAGIEEYFNLLQQYLTFSNMSFADYVVDQVEKVVCVTGRARFVWKVTGKGWEEVFAYRLAFVKEEGKWKVNQYEVWADSGSLQVAHNPIRRE